MIHAERNRALFLITVLGGLSVKETAALLVGDVLDEFGQVRDAIHLRPEQTKNKREHNVTVCKGLKAELQRYVATLQVTRTATSSHAILKLDDGNDNVLAEQFIEYTDFELDEIKLYACYNGNVWVVCCRVNTNFAVVL